jgi:hypothetical protein
MRCDLQLQRRQQGTRAIIHIVRSAESPGGDDISRVPARVVRFTAPAAAAAATEPTAAKATDVSTVEGQETRQGWVTPGQRRAVV